MNITVAGTGYVGLVTGISLAEIGHKVICYDVNEEIIITLKSGKSTVYEPGLDNMLIRNVEEKRLFFTCDPQKAYASPEIIVIAVGTPEKEDGSADLAFIKQVTFDIAHYFQSEELIVLTKSTVPVGTNRKVKKWIEEELLSPIKLEVISNPEFLREGSALYDTFNGDRIIIGSDNKETFAKIEELYSPFNVPILQTDIESAEMIKYASNAFLATKISFINEIANICEKVGANIDDVSTGVGLDKRIGSSFLKAGIGYGGSCFPKDTKALVQLAGNVNHRFELLDSVIKVNNMQRIRLYKKAKEVLGNFYGKTVAVLGLTFKPNTDDTRESASLIIINELLKDGAMVNAYDPVAYKKMKLYFNKGITFTNNIEHAIRGAEVCLIITEWNEILNFPLIKYRELMKEPVIFDGRNCYKLDDVRSSNIQYYSIGRSEVIPPLR
ncbi:UDP-glucose dehydrogenase family protein [Metabacillus halosaccharovorans]|uniref:UDP-glucose dehydrogenase family protein n=1 Tax=Metabacillus halosaccharovorans TaxID=930124 RepID=UPI00203D9B9B|nr:UDP-glucose/GDP-mannose dehydrogenase family protein [Metabacillus halosaccharovorans]MCM3443792.1 UDP-glucose/GDP-mannose dehydrogenase family protein [Metabacillus halosaccharovorans]